MWTKLKTFTVSLAGVSVCLTVIGTVTGTPILQTVGGWLFTVSAVASIYLVYKDAKAKGKEALL